MLSGFYTAASGMLTQKRTLNVIANNIANINTPGFKKDLVVTTTFEQELVSRQESGRMERLGSGSPVLFVKDVEAIDECSAYQQTGQPFDAALRGEGYFTILGNDGKTFLTRNGNFSMDSEGFLVLEGIGKVLGKSGPLQVKSSDIDVCEDGSINGGSGKSLGSLLISRPAETATLEKYKNGLYAVSDKNSLETVSKPCIVHKALEQSNIDLNREYTLVMETQRNFQSCSTILKGLDQINQKTVSEIGKLV